LFITGHNAIKQAGKYPGRYPGAAMKFRTDLEVSQALPANGARVEYRDAMPDSRLRLIVQPSGVKSWALRYRQGGRFRKHTLGAYPTIGLADARKAAEREFQAALAGVDLLARKRAGGTGERSVAHAGTEYCRLRLPELAAGTIVHHKRELARLVEAFGDKDVDIVSTYDLAKYCDARRPAGPGAEKTTVDFAKAFFRWASTRACAKSARRRSSTGRPCAAARESSPTPSLPPSGAPANTSRRASARSSACSR
jgi:hypothetical protein